MSEAGPSGEHPPAGREDLMSALFANLVAQQTNMALMFLGQTPHPETGQPVRDLDAAKMFIDTLETLEVKTKGNLNKTEEGLLKRNLTALRMAFVEAANHEPAPATPQAKPQSEPPKPAASAETAAAEGAAEPAPSAGEAESRKKFSKKY